MNSNANGLQKHFSAIFALIMIAILLAVSLGIFLGSLNSRPMPTRLVEPTPDPNIRFIGGTAVRLVPDLNRRIEFVDAPIVAAPQAAGDTGEQPPPAPISTQPVVTPEPTRDIRQVIFVRYVVVPGDNLYAIADKMNSSIELIALHNLSNIDLTPGNVIDQLPIANPDYCPNQRAYVVRDKDTAYRIAVHFGTTPQILREINSLNPDYRVDVTQVICIP